MLIKLFRIVAVLVLLGLAVVGVYLWYAPSIAAPVVLSIKPGASVRAVARELRQRGVIAAAEPLVWLMRISGKDGLIKAGNYEIDRPLAPLALLDVLTAGDGTQF